MNTNTDKTQAPYDELSNIIDFENGELDEWQTLALFQHLVDNGHAWTLQGTYGRTAAALIQSGRIAANTARARAILSQVR